MKAMDEPAADLDRARREPDDITIAPDGRPMADQPAWRQDFPIDWPADQYVARRDFAKFLALISLAFTGGHGWVAAQELVRRRRAAPPRLRVASLAEIAIGASLVFTYPGDEDRCLLIRPDADTLLAYSQSCTHLSCPVVPKLDEGLLVCPCHHGSFELATGKNLSGPPPRPLPKIELELVDGEIFAVGVDLKVG